MLLFKKFKFIGWENMLKKVKKSTYAAILVFALMLLAGLLVYKDYGVSIDDPIQRIRSLVTYKYIMHTLFGRTIPALDAYPLASVYNGQYYGVFLQLPMVLIEDLTGFTMDMQSVWFMRHLVMFLYCYIGYICFYFTGKKLFHNDWIALLGTVMLFLYPRYFAGQFLYIKDMLFAATVMAAMWATVMFLEKGESFRWGVVFCIVTAITANQRFMGMIFPALLVGYLFLRDLFVRRSFRKGRRVIWKRIGVYAAIGFGFLLAYLAVSPACWTDTFMSFARSIYQFAYYDIWQGCSVFAGRFVYWDEIPWYYMSVWLLISLPILYLLLFFVSVPLFVVRTVRIVKTSVHAEGGLPENADTTAASRVFAGLLDAPFRYWLLSAVLFFAPLLLIIVCHSVVYTNWRQMYFLLVPFVICCMFALQWLYRKLTKKSLRVALTAVLLAGLLFQAGWIVVNHPFEIVYLNRTAVAYGDQFDRDSSRSSGYSALQYLAENAQEDTIVLNSSSCDYRYVMESVSLLSADQQARFIGEENGEYIIETYRYTFGDAVHEGYEEWYSFYVDGFKVVTIFKKCAD